MIDQNNQVECYNTTLNPRLHVKLLASFIFIFTFSRAATVKETKSETVCNGAGDLRNQNSTPNEETKGMRGANIDAVRQKIFKATGACVHIKSLCILVFL
jgi:hypothetical protein